MDRPLCRFPCKVSELPTLGHQSAALRPTHGIQRSSQAMLDSLSPTLK